MKNRISAAKKRLRSSRGESIAEVLVSLLISAVALVMLASMISASSRMISESRDSFAEYYERNNRLTKHVKDDDSIAEARFNFRDQTGASSFVPLGTGPDGFVHFAMHTRGGTVICAYWK